MNKFTLLIKTSRPLGWILAPLIFLLLSFGLKIETGFLFILQMILMSAPYSLFLYGVNDIYDYESDKLNPRKKLIQGIKQNRSDHLFIKRAAFISAGLLALSSLITLNLINILAMALLLFFSYFYSAPPIRLKERPPLDSISNGIILFSLFLLIISFSNSGFSIPFKIYLITLGVIGIHVFSTIMDYSADKKVGDKTFAVIFGKRTAAIVAFIIFALIFIFGNFETSMINYYLIFCSALFFITIIFPREKLGSLFFKLVYFGFILAGVLIII